jgi:hypothetical protein
MISAGSDGGDANWALAFFGELRLPAIQAPAAVNVAMPWAGINIGPELLMGLLHPASEQPFSYCLIGIE